MSKSAPAPPDYVGAANVQAQASKDIAAQQTAANRPNINTPFGFQSWTQGPNGQWGMQTGLGGGLAGTPAALQAQAGQNLGTPMDWSQFGAAQTGDQARDQAINAAYGQATSRLNPQWDQRQQAMSSQLANQGLDPNSQAARAAQMQFSQGRNDAYGSAMNSAIGQGTAAGSAVFNQNMMARQQAIADALRQRGQPLSELQSLQGLMDMPGVHQAGAGQTPNLLGAAQAQGQYGLGAWEAQNQANADAWRGGMQLAGTAASLYGLSDERAKTDIQRLGHEAYPGVPWASFRYKAAPEIGPFMGVIAQDMQAVAPRYVRTRPDGLLEVDYSFLLDEVPRGHE
jgi:hypothetical protein